MRKQNIHPVGIAMQSLMLEKQQTSNNGKKQDMQNMLNMSNKKKNRMKKRLCDNAIAFNHLLEDVTAWSLESRD
jgi:hypothetical protein